MNSKWVIRISIVYFVLVNTVYFLENISPLVGLIVTTLILLAFLALVIILIRQVILLIKEKASQKSRVFSTCILLLTIITCYLFPLGIIRYDDLWGEDLFIASREGAANCQTILKIKKNKNFICTSLCFGVERSYGSYSLNNDTIKFNYHEANLRNDQYTYGLLKFKESSNHIKKAEILLFRDYKDTIGISMNVIFPYITGLQSP